MDLEEDFGYDARLAIRRSGLVQWDFLWRIGTRAACLPIYSILFIMLIKWKNTFNQHEIMMRVLILHHIFVNAATLYTTKQELDTLNKYHGEPIIIRNQEDNENHSSHSVFDTFRGFLEITMYAQYPLFWFFNSAFILFQLITFITPSKKVYRLFHIYFFPLALFAVIVLPCLSPKHMEFLMLGVMFLIWSVNQKHMVSHIYTLGLTSKDITCFRNLNMLISSQVLLAILYHFLKSGLYFVMNASIKENDLSKDFNMFYKDLIFVSISSIASVINALLLAWIAYGFSRAKLRKTSTLPVITTAACQSIHGSSISEFSRRPSTISAFSISVSPTPSFMNSNSLHV